jgi:predicted acetyltransferase
MGIEIRAADPEDLPAAVTVISAAFLERPDNQRVADYLAETLDPGRFWVAWDGSQACGTFRSWSTEITLPGLQRLSAAAVAAVTVRPTHRRRGVLRQMAAKEHAAIRERGEAMGLLYASEFGIYGRFGYGPATRQASWTVDLARTRFADPGGDDGCVELVTPDTAIRDEVSDLYDAWRMASVGEIRRRDSGWDVRLGLREEPWSEPWKSFVALHRDQSGRLDGYASYKAEPKWQHALPVGRLDVHDLFAATQPAEASLWSFLGSTDLVTTLKAHGRSPSDRLPWRLANPRGATLGDVDDGMWVRLFDVPRALAARTYEGVGSLVLEVIDDQAAGGRWRLALDAAPDGATCVTTDRSPDLTLPVAALGSVYLGAHRLSDVALRLGVDEHSDGALARADALFRTAVEPWCSTFF